MRFIILLTLLTGTAIGKVTEFFGTSFVKASVTQVDTSLFMYSYTLNTAEVDRRELSSFEVYLCETVPLDKPQATPGRFKISRDSESIKWEPIANSAHRQTVTFTFASTNKPMESLLRFKIANNAFVERAPAPSCHPDVIPESGVALLGAIGLTLLLRRTRKQND